MSSDTDFEKEPMSTMKKEEDEEKDLEDENPTESKPKIAIKRNRINITELPGFVSMKPKKRIRRDSISTLLRECDKVFEDDEFEAYSTKNINMNGYRQRYYIECENDNLEIIKKWFWDSIEKFSYVFGSYNYDYIKKVYNINIVLQLKDPKRFSFFNTMPSKYIDLSACGYFWYACIKRVEENKSVFINYEERSPQKYGNQRDFSFNDNILINKENLSILLESTKKMYDCLEHLSKDNICGSKYVKELKPPSSPCSNSSSSSSSSSSTTPRRNLRTSSADVIEIVPINKEIKPKEKESEKKSEEVQTIKDASKEDQRITDENSEEVSSKEKEKDEKKETKKVKKEGSN